MKTAKKRLQTYMSNPYVLVQGLDRAYIAHINIYIVI